MDDVSSFFADLVASDPHKALELKAASCRFRFLGEWEEVKVFPTERLFIRKELGNPHHNGSLLRVELRTVWDAGRITDYEVCGFFPEKSTINPVVSVSLGSMNRDLAGPHIEFVKKQMDDHAKHRDMIVVYP